MQKETLKYCDLCGSPIRGKGHAVVYEGGIITVCDSCYARIAKYAKPYNPQHKADVTRKPKVKPKEVAEKELMVVDDYATIIKNARERLNMSQKDLADKLKVSEGIIKRFEAGKLRPTLEQAKELEKVLGVKLIVEVPVSASSNEKAPDSLTLGDIAVIREKK